MRVREPQAAARSSLQAEIEAGTALEAERTELCQQLEQMREERGGWDSRGYDRGASGSGERDRNRVRMWKPKDSFGEEY